MTHLGSFPSKTDYSTAPGEKQAGCISEWISSVVTGDVHVVLQRPLLVVVGDRGTNRWCKAFKKSNSVFDKMPKVPHLITFPQKRQLVAVDGTFHHVDVIVFNTEV